MLPYSSARFFFFFFQCLRPQSLHLPFCLFYLVVSYPGIQISRKRFKKKLAEHLGSGVIDPRPSWKTLLGIVLFCSAEAVAARLGLLGLS